MRRVGSLIIDARRNALRTRRRVGLAVAIALTVGVSCGVGTSALLGLERVVFGSLPFPDADRLVSIRTIDRFDPSRSERVTGKELNEWKERSRLIESFGGSEPPRVGGVVGDQSGPLVRLSWVTSDLFTTLGVKPLIGSVFTGPRTRETQWQLVLGYRMWQRYFAGDHAAIGKSMRFTGLAQSWTVIGVMPPAFEFPEGVDGWIPTWSMSQDPAGRVRANSNRDFDVVARLRPGVTVDQAQAELRSLSSQMAASDDIGNRGWTPTVTPLRAVAVGNYARLAWALGAAAALLWIMACANIGSLVRTAVSSRTTELAVRLSLGASRADSFCVVLLEVLIYVAIGVVIALVLAFWLTTAQSLIFPTSLRADGTWRALLLPLLSRTAILVFIILAVASFTIWRRTAADDDGIGRTLGNGLRAVPVHGVGILVAQIGPAVALILVTSVCLRTVFELYQRDLGYEPRGLVVAQVTPPREASNRVSVSMPELLQRLRARPGVSGAELISSWPFDEDMRQVFFDRNNRPVDRADHVTWTADESIVTPGYFNLMGIETLAGRTFDATLDPPIPPSNRDAPRSVVVSASLARRLWSDMSVGRRIGNDLVIGVVEDATFRGLDDNPRPRMYYSYSQRSNTQRTVLVRASNSAAAMSAVREEAAHVLGAGAWVAGVRTGEALLADRLANQRAAAALLGLLGCVCLVLMTTGVWFVFWDVVRAREREIGVRIALGASRRHILQWMARNVTTPLIAACVLGSLAGIGLVQVVSALFFGTARLDAWSVLAAAAALLTAGLVASGPSVLRAARTDPMVALRAD